MSPTHEEADLQDYTAANADNEPLIARGVSVYYSGVRALDGVDIDLKPNEIVGLIGPNGSGKTTLVNVLSGVTPPTRGEFYYGNHNLTSVPSHRVAALGIARTFQHIRLFDNMTTLQNVEVGASLHNTRPRGAHLRAHAIESLSLLGLESVVHRRTGTLPYGVRRRVEIARAMASGPRFLLLDEPAAGANESESDELCDLITEIHKHYVPTILAIEHDLRIMMRLTHRIIALGEGKVIADGSPAYVANHPDVRAAYLGRRRTEDET